MENIRLVTAASLFDGHDASINIIRRLLQQSGAEIIHLGHNRSVHEVVTTALQEDVHGIALSSYQGGHVEYFKYMIHTLKSHGADHIRVFGGGGGVIIPKEIQELQDYGVQRIYSPEDGHRLGLQGIIDDMLNACRSHCHSLAHPTVAELEGGNQVTLARIITALENNQLSPREKEELKQKATQRGEVPVLGITGTGGAGKSSLTDEIIQRFYLDGQEELKIAILAIDPTRRKTGGALLGDRIRMNSIYRNHLFMRSLATRSSQTEVPEYIPDIINATKASGYDLIIVETPGIGQGDAGIVPMVDVSLYIMTPEFGASSQLEKIDMLDFAHVVALNKFDRKGAEDGWRAVAKQIQRNRGLFSKPLEEMPVYGTMASKHNDQGVTALYQGLLSLLKKKGLPHDNSLLSPVKTKISPECSHIIPPSRQRYLGEIASTLRQYHQETRKQARAAREKQQLEASLEMLKEKGEGPTNTCSALKSLAQQKQQELHPHCQKLLDEWPSLKERYGAEEFTIQIRDKKIQNKTTSTTLSGTVISRVSLPSYEDHGELLSWLRRENLPGYFPYTAGVFAFKRTHEDPTRMFAG